MYVEQLQLKKDAKSRDIIKRYLAKQKGIEKVNIIPVYPPVCSGKLTVYYSYIDKDNKIDDDNNEVLDELSNDPAMIAVFAAIFGDEYIKWRKNDLETRIKLARYE